MWYAGEKYTAKAIAEQVHPFVCVSCGHKVVARVVGAGTGVAHSPFFLDRAASRLRAQRDANLAANIEATLALGLAACPACGWRDQEALGRMKRAAIIASAKTLPVVFVCSWLVLQSVLPSPLSWFGSGALAQIGAWLMYRSRSWHWRTADERVQFDGA